MKPFFENFRSWAAFEQVVTVSAACTVMLPFVFADALPLYDIPNHLARLHVLGAPAASTLRHVYTPHWALIPDLGVDMIYTACKWAATPETVVRGCLVGSLVLLIVAIWSMQRALWHRINYTLVLAPLLTSGLCFFMGYINYVLSVSVSLAGLALYLNWRASLSARRLAVLCGIATLAWFCHIAGFLVFGLLLSIIDLTGRHIDNPSRSYRQFARQSFESLIVAASIFAPGLMLSLLAESQSADSRISYGAAKLRLLVAPVMLTGNYVEACILFILIIAVIFGFVRGNLRVAPLLRPALLLLALLIVAAPWQIGQAVDVDSRLVLPWIVVALAGVSGTPPLSRVVQGGFLVILIIVLVQRDLSFLDLGREEASEIARLKVLVGALPAGSAMLTADYRTQSVCPLREKLVPPLAQLASYATIERGIYTPSIFTGSGMQPLRALKAPFPPSAHVTLVISVKFLEAFSAAKGLEALQANNPTDPDIHNDLTMMQESGGIPVAPYWPAQYQSLLVLHDGCGVNPLPDRLSLIGSGDSFSLFRIHPPA